MRQLITNDVYKMSRILKKLDLKTTDIKIDDGENSDQQFGIALLLKATESIGLAQDEINDFIGSLCEPTLTGKQFGELPIKQSLEIIKKFKSLDGISDFFKSAGQLMK